MRCDLKALPIQTLLGAQVAQQMLAEPALVGMLAREGEHYFNTQTGDFSSYGRDEQDFVDLLDYPEFAEVYELAKGYAQEDEAEEK